MEASNPIHHHSDIRHDAVISALEGCVIASERCIGGCLLEADILIYAKCIKLAHDCASLCTWAAQLLLRDSEMARAVLLICAQACKRTALECGRFYKAHCQIAATHCKAAEKACYALHEDSL